MTNESRINRREFIAGGATFLTAGAAALNLAANIEAAQNSPDEKEKIMRIQRLSWAGIKIEVGQTTVFVDAIGDDAEHLKADTADNFALVTHHHGDHCDPAALKKVFNDKSILICHEDVAPWIDNRVVRIQTAKMYQPLFLSRATADIAVIPVPAVDGFGHPQVSWIIEGGGKRIIHCGDTLWHGHWWDIARAYGVFDAAFMPINGARQVGKHYTSAGIPMVMTPDQAVAAAKVLRAKIVCPIHYGQPSENYFEVDKPEETFVKAAQSAKIPFQIVKNGDYLNWAG